MVEETITTRDSRKVNLKYDKEKYSIEYFKGKDMIILKRLSDNQILEVFNDKIGFITQCNTEEQVNFLVTQYCSRDNESKSETIKFNHYTDRWYLDSLQLENSFDCESMFLSAIRITDKSYLVEQSGYTSCIYNLSQKSKRFKRVYNDQKVKAFFSDNTLLVSELIFGGRDDLNDTITYGINPETFEITTPIWSDLQQRSINVYTKEQLDKIRDELSKKGMVLNIEELGEATIYFEVERYMHEIAEQLDGQQSVYRDVFANDVNEDFVRKFVK